MPKKASISSKRGVSKYLEDDSDTVERTTEQIAKMVQCIEALESTAPKYAEQARLLKTLAHMAAADQEQAAMPGGADSMLDSSEYVVQLIVCNGKAAALLSLLGSALRELPTTTADSEARALLSEVIKSLLILIKCCTDTRGAFSVFNRKSFFTVLSYIKIAVELASLDASARDLASLCATLYIYCLYNAARHADSMQPGIASELFELFGTHQCIQTALELYTLAAIDLSEECLMTLAEFIAILAESELYLDYAETYLDENTSSVFLRFYDGVVKGIMADPDERRKMLSLDEVISYVKREHAAVWAAHMSASAPQ